MKKKFFITLTAVVLLGVGVGAFLYANSQKFTIPTTTLSPEKERVFEFIPNDARYDPETQRCMAYVYWDIYNSCYVVTTTPIDYGSYFFIESREGELVDCSICQYRCSAYYELCDMYNVEPEDKPVQ